VDFVADLQHGGDERQDRDVAVRAGWHPRGKPVVDEVVADQIADLFQLTRIHRVERFGGKCLC